MRKLTAVTIGYKGEWKTKFIMCNCDHNARLTLNHKEFDALAADYFGPIPTGNTIAFK